MPSKAGRDPESGHFAKGLCQEVWIQLASKLDAYHKAAAPLWEKFSERLGYAHTYAEKKKNAALSTFLLAFRHNHGRHTASKAAAQQAGPAQKA